MAEGPAVVMGMSVLSWGGEGWKGRHGVEDRDVCGVLPSDQVLPGVAVLVGGDHPLSSRGGRRSAEGGDAGDVAADDQRLHGIGALVGGDDLHVGQVTGDMVLQQQTVTRQQLAGLVADPLALL